MSTKTDTTAPISIITKLENFGHEALDAIEHGAVWLVGEVSQTTDSLHELGTTRPWLVEAWNAGLAAAEAHGVPLGAISGIEDVGAAILAAAKTFAAGLAQLAPTVTPVVAAEPLAVVADTPPVVAEEIPVPPTAAAPIAPEAAAVTQPSVVVPPIDPVVDETAPATTDTSVVEEPATTDTSVVEEPATTDTSVVEESPVPSTAAVPITPAPEGATHSTEDHSA